MKTSDCAALSAHSQLAPTPENLTHLLEVVSEAVIVVHRNSGRLLAANSNACTLYGYPRHVLMDMRYPDLATETKSVVAIFSERREHVPLRYHRRSDGRHFPVEMSLRWAGREPDDYAFIAIRDVSELFRRERQDKSDGQRYQALFKAAPYPLYLLNSRGIIVEANTAALERYACEMSDLMEQHISRLLDDDQQAPRYYLSRQSFLPAQWHRRLDGSRFLADIQLSRQKDNDGTQTLVAVRDITEERALLERLKASEERWRFALEGQGDGLWDWNLESAELVVSDDFREALGLTYGSGQENLAAWIGKVHPEDTQALEQALISLMKGNSTLIEHQLRVRCRNGDYRWLFLRGKVMDWNMQGRAMRIVGSVRDVEEEKQQADHERTRNEQILHTARLVSMGEIASALAHEINQPLTAICNFSAVALHKLKAKGPENELSGLLQTIAEQAMRAGQITHQIRSFVKKGKTTLRPLSIDRLISSLLPLAELQAKSFDASLSLEITAPLPQVMADQVQVEQLLLNLIRNGLEAMKDSAGARRLIIRAAIDAEQMLRIDVVDHGCGLPETMQNGHWETFYSSKEDGLGMGLSICRSIIENHRGHIWTLPNPNGGTTFCFTLPILPEESHAD